MYIHIVDRQVVGETEDTLFSVIQNEADMVVILENLGVNTMNYKFQQFSGSAWEDMDVSGTDLYNTLTAGSSRMIKVDASYPQVRLRGNASGGAELNFSVTRMASRSSGGAIPILSL